MNINIKAIRVTNNGVVLVSSDGKRWAKFGGKVIIEKRSVQSSIVTGEGWINFLYDFFHLRRSKNA